MVATVEVAVVHLWLDATSPLPVAVVLGPTIMPALACNTFL